MTTLQDRQKYCRLFLVSKHLCKAMQTAVLVVRWRAGCYTWEAFASYLCVSFLARCAIKGRRGRGAWGGWARGSSRGGSSRTPGPAAWGASRGADGSWGLWPRNDPSLLLLAGLLLLSLQGLTAHMVMLLPVFMLAEGAAVACRVAAAARLTGLASAVPAALTHRKRQSQITKNCSQTENDLVGVMQPW